MPTNEESKSPPSLFVMIARGSPLSNLADSPLLEYPPVKTWAATGKIKGVVFMSNYVLIGFFDDADMDLIKSQLSEYVPPSQLGLSAEDKKRQTIRIYFKPTRLVE